MRCVCVFSTKQIEKHTLLIIFTDFNCYDVKHIFTNTVLILKKPHHLNPIKIWYWLQIIINIHKISKYTHSIPQGAIYTVIKICWNIITFVELTSIYDSRNLASILKKVYIIYDSTRIFKWMEVITGTVCNVIFIKKCG